MTDAGALWATLHDGMLEHVHFDDGVVSLRVDVPHVRHHAGLPSEARFCILLRGRPALTVSRFHEPRAPRPAGSDQAAHDAWSALGTMRSMDCDAFVASLAEPRARFAIVEAELATAGARTTLELRGDYRGSLAAYAWVELRLEASAITFAHEGGEEIPESAFGALGEAYWAAWRERNGR